MFRPKIIWPQTHTDLHRLSRRATVRGKKRSSLRDKQ
jgi:hypothetical protein